LMCMRKDCLSPNTWEVTLSPWWICIIYLLFITWLSHKARSFLNHDLMLVLGWLISLQGQLGLKSLLWSLIKTVFGYILLLGVVFNNVIGTKYLSTLSINNRNGNLADDRLLLVKSLCSTAFFHKHNSLESKTMMVKGF